MNIVCKIINLKKRKDRYKNITDSLKRYWSDLEYERFNAITPKTLKNKLNIIYNKDEIKNFILNNFNLARVSCRLSHLIVLQDFIVNEKYKNCELFLIMEDDLVIIKDEISDILSKIKNDEEVYNNIDVLHIYVNKKKGKLKNYDSNLLKIKNSNSTAGYIVKKCFLKQYFTLLKKDFYIKYGKKDKSLKLNQKEYLASEHFRCISKIDKYRKYFNNFYVLKDNVAKTRCMGSDINTYNK